MSLAQTLALNLARDAFLWGLGSMCQLHRVPFSAPLVEGAAVPPFTVARLIEMAAALGFTCEASRLDRAALARMPTPLLVALTPADSKDGNHLALLLAVRDDAVLILRHSAAQPETLSHADFDAA